jgi:hypothetical protein
MVEPSLPDLKSDKMLDKGNINNFNNSNLLGKIKLSKETPKQKFTFEDIKNNTNIIATKEKPKFNLDFLNNSSTKHHEKLNFLLQNKVNHRRNYSEIIKQQNTEKIVRKKILFENLNKKDSSNNLESIDYPRNASRPSTTKHNRKHNQSIDILIKNSRNKILIESSFLKDKNCLNTSNMSIKLFNSIEDNESSSNSNSKKVSLAKNYNSKFIPKNLNASHSHSGTNKFNFSRIENSNAIEESFDLLKKKQNELKNKIKFEEFGFYDSNSKETNDYINIDIFEKLFLNFSGTQKLELYSHFSKNDVIKKDYLFRKNKENEAIGLSCEKYEIKNPQFKENSLNQNSLFNKKFKIIKKDMLINNLSPTSQKFNFSTASTTSHKTKIFYNDSKFDTKTTDKNIINENKFSESEQNKEFTPKNEITKKEIQRTKKFSINDVEPENSDFLSRILNTPKNTFNPQLEIDNKIQISITKKEDHFLSSSVLTEIKPSEINLSLNTCKKEEPGNDDLENDVFKIEKNLSTILIKKTNTNNPPESLEVLENQQEIKNNLLDDPEIILKTEKEPKVSNEKPCTIEKAPLFLINELAKATTFSNSKLNIYPLNDQGNLLSSINEQTIPSPQNAEKLLKINSIQFNQKSLNTLNYSQCNNSYMTFVKNELNYENSHFNQMSINSYLDNKSFVDENLQSDDISTKTINTQSIEDDEDFDF